jgi:putative hydrolase of the HAD superfamily
MIRRQHLVIDADDTLWENNIYFEQAFARFHDFLAHSTLDADQVRDHLDAIEIENIKIHGYGAENFSRNLRQCLAALAERPVSEADLDQVTAFALDILNHPIVLLDGVAETLMALSERHELVLFTKGAPSEQQAKIERSGLDHLFDHAAIVREKDIRAYEQLATERSFRLDSTWMVGNSPKSDINPALHAGWNAAFVPHERTWSLERMDLVNPGPGKLLVLDRFPDLLQHF